MAIGIDNDEVLYPLVEGLRLFLNRKYGLNIQTADFTKYDYWEVIPGYGVTEYQAKEDMREFTETEDFMRMPPIPGSIEGIRELRKLGELYVITSRTDKLAEKTQLILEKHHFPGTFSRFVFGNTSTNEQRRKIPKRELIRNNPVWLHLEDHYETALDVSEDIPVILFDKPYNQHRQEHENIFPVGNWREPGTDWKKAVEKARDLYAQRNS